MKNIKFKVWDKVLKCWSKNTAYFHQNKDGIVSPDLGDRYIFVQYTGLKDKNGVEIYEGDIVLTDPCDGGGTCDGKRAYPVTWQSAGFHYPIDVSWRFGCHNEIREVIGNIHENPELSETE